MKATILGAPPLSGDIEEISLTKDGSGLWVKFEASEGSEYCVVFGCGSTEATILDVHGDIAFVLAHGQGYAFDVVAKEQLFKTEQDDFRTMAVDDETGYAIACSCEQIEVFDKQHMWSSGPVAFDGFVLEKTTGGRVTGQAFTHDGWQPFSLDLNTFEFAIEGAAE